MGKAKRILILSVKAGAGHLRAAQALEEAFRERYPKLDVRNEDALQYTNAAFRKTYSQTYEKVVANIPSLWQFVYESMEEMPVDSRVKKLGELWDRLNTRRLTDMIDEFQPDRIVCTHYLPAEKMASRRRRGKLSAFVSVVLTDYDIHTMWVQDGVNHYFVATDEMAHALSLKGVGDATVDVTGIPVTPAFAKRYPGRPAMRRKLGLRPDAPTVLISAGGFGMMKADEAVAALAKRLPEAQFITVAGRNEELHKRLKRVAARHEGTIAPFGFVDNMHELMAASDLAVAKSGGLTTSESLALGLPLVVFHPIPGQEERNATYLLERGAGVWAHTAAHMMYKVEQLLNDPARLRRMRLAARRTAKPSAAYDIAAQIVARKD
ncbi:MAG: glycosyltransferase [bacterium]|nr:glycosyltransferase [bacterium]